MKSKDVRFCEEEEELKDEERNEEGDGEVGTREGVNKKE